ncbi:7875_t:CDS:2, partial [Gigaspora rosea]
MDQYSNYGGQQDPSSTGYNYQSYNDAYSQSGYTAPTNTSEYYYGGNNTPAGGNGNESSGTNPQPTAPPSASSQGYTSREGYEVNGYSSSYNYGNYPPSATSGNYQAGPGSSGGSTTQQYNGTNKTGYADRDNDYGDGPGYSSNKNPYDGYGGNYKSRENNREGYGPPSKDGSYDSYGNRPKDGSVVQTSTDTVYISNLSKDVTEEKLADYFGGLGMLKIDKKTQKPK